MEGKGHSLMGSDENRSGSVLEPWRHAQVPHHGLLLPPDAPPDAQFLELMTGGLKMLLSSRVKSEGKTSYSKHRDNQNKEEVWRK